MSNSTLLVAQIIVWIGFVLSGVLFGVKDIASHNKFISKLKKLNAEAKADRDANIKELRELLGKKEEQQ